MTAIAASPMLRAGRPVKQDRGIEFAVSALLHIVVFAGLSTVLLVPRAPPPPPAPMDVTIADDVGLQATAPTPPTESAAARSPDVGPTEESSPPPVPSEEKSDPAPPALQPKAALPPKPAVITKPQPAKPVPQSAAPAKTQAKPAIAPAKPVAKSGKGNGSNAASNQQASRKPLFSKNQMDSWGKSPSKPITAPPGAVANGKQQADFRQRIADQIQPCARNHRLPPTPGISGVRVVMTLSFARDGRLSAEPRIVRIEGLSDEAQRYADLVRRSAFATFNDKQCQPISGLDPELYDVPNGWRSVTLGFKLPG